ncbi:hypothetical protein [Pedobacter endophyticus]|uniref:Uncharacterized protein n=1 Tax=Pedobacter endophyticus TaxID=2789740 RepID=A0A7S9PYF8_9SPHI|nr:hypothetical protein [Pedobacter endophyticus]QPH39318.1 hypothetical protein IZT61_20105 [Pedobacter endophyticus]
MITTTFLLLLMAFEICYLTSKQYKQTNPPAYVATLVSNKNQFRIGALFLLFVATAMLVVNLGWASGIATLIFGLMAAGSLIVSLQPFRYFRVATIAAVYFAILLLEIFI